MIKKSIKLNKKNKHNMTKQKVKKFPVFYEWLESLGKGKR